MREKLNRPKRFAEVLDVIFSLSRYHFKDFLKIFFIVLGPIILLELIILLSIGKPFFRDVSYSSNWFESWVTSFLTDDLNLSLKEELSNIVIAFLFTFFGMFAQIAVLYVVNHIRKDEKYILSDTIKNAFSKVLPIIGVLLLISFALGVFIVFIIIGVFILAILFDILPVFIGVIFSILAFIALIVGMIYFFTRFIFSIAKIAFDSPIIQSFSKSWEITKGRVLFIFGLFFLIMMIINVIMEGTTLVTSLLLGNSALYSLIGSVVMVFTTMIGSVAYAVIYFDAKSRHDASDLKQMIEQYKQD